MTEPLSPSKAHALAQEVENANVKSFRECAHLLARYILSQPVPAEPAALDPGKMPEDKGGVPSTWPTRFGNDDHWSRDAAGFVRIVQDNPGFWPNDFALKYLNVRIDTRNGCFVLTDDRKQVRSPADVLKAIKEWNRDYTEQTPTAQAKAAEPRTAPTREEIATFKAKWDRKDNAYCRDDLDFADAFRALLTSQDAAPTPAPQDRGEGR